MADTLRTYRRHLPWDRRYVKFNVPYVGYGWNNALQDMIMVSQIAVLANRGYVFPPYIWSTNRFTPVVLSHSLRLGSAVIPLNAFLSGPLAGGPYMDVGDGGGNRDPHPRPPRSISYDWWETVCPPSRRVIIDVTATQRELGIELGYDPSGKDIQERWGKKLNDLNDTCIQVDGAHVFTFW